MRADMYMRYVLADADYLVWPIMHIMCTKFAKHIFIDEPIFYQINNRHSAS
jgi:hypothetical protein